jgi:hypothetical protein
MPPSLHDVTGALRTNAAKLFDAAGRLQADGRNADATLDEQEAQNCKNRAEALDAGASFKNFPSAAVLQQLADDCDALQTAIDKSAGVNDLVSAADKVRKSMPANTV